jgi:carboxyl-terminal processing protease
MAYLTGGNAHRPNFRMGVRWLIIILLSFVSLQNLHCTKKSAPFVPTDQLGIDNKWVYDSLKRYYYWADQITGNPEYTLPTDQFFRKLLSASDRFSWISNGSTVGPSKTTAELFGFQYTLISHPFEAQQLAAVITLVVPDSYAGRQGLQRGMFFTKINDKVITPQNMQSLVTELQSNSSAVLRLAALNSDGTALIDSARVAVQSSFVDDKCVYATKFFEKQGTKTGYLAYFLCSETEDVLMMDAVQKLKNANVTELILDLRYNPGGSVASSAKLAAMLVTSFDPDQVYVTFKGNRNGGTVKQTFRQTIAFSGSNSGKDMNELRSLNLGLQRIFILTSGATVSAAELLCNSLKPYLQVIRIGAITHGKDEASFRIEDTRNPRQVQWMLMPTIYKVFDANERGDYSSGLQPDHAVNDFARLPLLQDLGSPGDPSLDKALTLIYGSTQVDVTPLRQRSTFKFSGVKVWYSSGAEIIPGVELKRPR